MINNFRYKFTAFLLSFLCCVLISCNSDNPNTSNIEVDIEFKHFTKDLLTIKGELTVENLSVLQKKYGSFYNDYVTHIMGFGAPLSDSAIRALNYFKMDEHEHYLNKLVQEKYGDFKKEEKAILKAYKNYLHYFPNDSLRDVVTYISNFTMNINPVGDDYTGLSLEMYMGDTFTAYKVIKPEIPTFLHKLFTPRQVPIQNMKSIVNEKLRLAGGHKGRVLDEMILWGKLFYICEKTLLDAEEYEIIGYDAEEWEWAIDNESQIWKFFIKDKKMFENINGATMKLFTEGPRTNYEGVPIDYCVPMLGKFSGWMLVKSYMENNNISLQELVNQTNSDEILKLSEYKP